MAERRLFRAVRQPMTLAIGVKAPMFSVSRRTRMALSRSVNGPTARARLPLAQSPGLG